MQEFLMERFFKSKEDLDHFGNINLVFNFAFIPSSLESGVITFEGAVNPNTQKQSQNSAETSSKNIRIKCVVSVTVFLRINFFYLFSAFSHEI